MMHAYIQRRNVSMHHPHTIQLAESWYAIAVPVQLHRYSCTCLSRHFGSKVKLWATFNEPGVMGFCGWIYGTFPPAKTIQFATAGQHMCNMLRAHTAAYKAIKTMPGEQMPETSNTAVIQAHAELLHYMIHLCASHKSDCIGNSSCPHRSPQTAA